jgi:hypothetical protein
VNKWQRFFAFDRRNWKRAQAAVTFRRLTDPGAKEIPKCALGTESFCKKTTLKHLRENTVNGRK